MDIADSINQLLVTNRMIQDNTYGPFYLYLWLSEGGPFIRRGCQILGNRAWYITGL